MDLAGAATGAFVAGAAEPQDDKTMLTSTSTIIRVNTFFFILTFSLLFAEQNERLRIIVPVDRNSALLQFRYAIGFLKLTLWSFHLLAIADVSLKRIMICNYA